MIPMKLLAVQTAVLLVLGACGTAAVPGSTPGTVSITRKDDGRTIDLHPGDRLVVELEGNPTTGYSWEARPSPDSKVIKQAGEPRFQAKSNNLGSGGTVYLTYEAVNVGQADLHLIYHRAWEKNVDPAATFQVTVIITR